MTDEGTYELIRQHNRYHEGNSDPTCPYCAWRRHKMTVPIDKYNGVVAMLKRADDKIDELKAMLKQAEAMLFEVSRETCLRAASEFRGSCGRDGRPEQSWCVVCRAKAVAK